METQPNGTVSDYQKYYAHGAQRMTTPSPRTTASPVRSTVTTPASTTTTRDTMIRRFGHFISPDTIVPDPLRVDSYNRYMYSLGNPLRFSDPSGHCALNANGDPDTVGDYDCWQLAYGIYGFGLTEQSFADDWRVSPDEWLKNIAGTSYATIDSLKPFYDKYEREFRGRTGLHSADSLNPVTNPEIELPGPLQHVAESVVYSAIDCARDAPLGCSNALRSVGSCRSRNRDGFMYRSKPEEGV
ncbi:MAG: hypothetical protein M9896_19840 [Candidatus Promineofilum sp.]|uniref:hypothetical protein n=1 Tax=Promineifilum sp. TaxID=2664178 RepID=UPI002411E665|nr:hypothetical protein [Promineifilum sp.]